MSTDLERSPRSLLVCERSSLLDEKNRLREQVEQQHFNCKVTVLLPGCDSAPSDLDMAMKSFQSFYLIRKLPLYELLDQHFLKTAVCQGVCGLSYKTRIDEDNCVFLMPNGRLCLSLDKDSYELLGVEGKAWRSKLTRVSRYVVSIDVTPGGRDYQRLLTGLTSRLLLRMDFLLSSHSGGGAALQPLLSRYDWSEHTPDVRSHTVTHLPCPALMTSDLQSYDPFSFLEWLGAVAADVSCDNTSDSFLSSLAYPDMMNTAAQSLSFSVSGLLLPHDILSLIQELRRYLEWPRSMSWVAMTVHGFDSVYAPGEPFYTLLLFQDHTYCLHMATSTLRSHQ
ncbi:ribonuclease P protein subunit p40 [Dunckerocampus dactyliophorus]|uniref:ribonuclease P protein subunit p40 n=1 Tax=Dunckerocampus dactyliophorus TaxID=161453 RepID=UPI0024065374|nr:ribonuclease P protein subunit p40 [Dunckerocampus dactyliophorus]